MIEPKPAVSAHVLGTMQDGGLPHIGCLCPRCRAALDDPSQARFTASLAVVDRRGAQTAVYIIDATPDLGRQVALLADDLGRDSKRPDRLRQPDAIFLTHAHLGHIGGLPQLGPEAMAVRDLPVYAPSGLVDLLQSTVLWRPLLERLSLRVCRPGKAIELGHQLSITAVPVPHRDEWQAGTVAYLIAGPNKSLFYLPDIDSWQAWPAANSFVSTADYALVDASFYSAAELGGRAPVAHPLVADTLQRFAGMPGRLLLTHINHTNPILDVGSPEWLTVREAGVEIAERGLTLGL